MEEDKTYRKRLKQMKLEREHLFFIIAIGLGFAATSMAFSLGVGSTGSIINTGISKYRASFLANNQKVGI